MHGSFFDNILSRRRACVLVVYVGLLRLRGVVFVFVYLDLLSSLLSHQLLQLMQVDGLARLLTVQLTYPLLCFGEVPLQVGVLLNQFTYLPRLVLDTLL